MSTSTPPAADADRVAARDIPARIEERLLSLSRRGINSSVALFPPDLLHVVLTTPAAAMPLGTLCGPAADLIPMLDAFSDGLNIGREHQHPERLRRQAHDLVEAVEFLNRAFRDADIDLRATIAPSDLGTHHRTLTIAADSPKAPPTETLNDSCAYLEPYVAGIAAAVEFLPAHLPDHRPDACPMCGGDHYDNHPA